MLTTDVEFDNMNMHQYYRFQNDSSYTLQISRFIKSAYPEYFDLNCTCGGKLIFSKTWEQTQSYSWSGKFGNEKYHKE